MSKSFDPANHLMKVRGGAEYLEVKWRLVWLRTVHPDAAIDTDMISMNEQHAIFKATVTLPSGGSATGWGSETPGDFRDYIEKAETKALGRALAALGFGTQFTGDDLSEGERIVDAPVSPRVANLAENYTPRHDAPVRSQEPRRDAQPRQQASWRNFYPATEKQIETMKKTLIRLNGNPRIVDTLMSQGPGISKTDASAWISTLFEGTIPPKLMADDDLSTPPDPYEPPDDREPHNDSDPIARNADLIEGFGGGSTNPMFS